MYERSSCVTYHVFLVQRSSRHKQHLKGRRGKTTGLVLVDTQVYGEISPLF